MNDNALGSSHHPQALYEHIKRKDWGLAIVAWQRDDRRAYQFEDGKMRIFKEQFYGLFTEVDRPLDASSKLVNELNRKIDVSEARQGLREEATAKGKDVYTLKDQIEIFLLEYPGGFAGQNWQAEVRGNDPERALKRHRNPAVAAAAELISKEALEPLMESGELDEIWQRAIKVADSTDLIAASQVRDLQNLSEDKVVPFARAFYELLHGEDELEGRIDAFLAAAPEGIAWQTATVHLALLRPTEHVCVQPTSFRQQAKWMAPRLKYNSTPTGDLYTRFLTMTHAVKERLERSDVTPADLIDVHDFIRLSMRPRARARLEEVRKARLDNIQPAPKA